MITGTCPYCGSTDWNHVERIDDDYGADECWAEWICHCRGCKNDFKRLESYELAEATHEAFEED